MKESWLAEDRLSQRVCGPTRRASLFHALPCGRPGVFTSTASQMVAPPEQIQRQRGAHSRETEDVKFADRNNARTRYLVLLLLRLRLLLPSPLSLRPNTHGQQHCGWSALRWAKHMKGRRDPSSVGASRASGVHHPSRKTLGGAHHQVLRMAPLASSTFAQGPRRMSRKNTCSASRGPLGIAQHWGSQTTHPKFRSASFRLERQVRL